MRRQAGHGAPPAGARVREMEACADACPDGGHAVTRLGQKAAGQVFFRLSLVCCTNLNRVQGSALVLFLPAFSRENRAPPEAYPGRGRFLPGFSP